MEIDISTLMLGFFVIFLVLSIWKIWAFLPNKQLADDDTTADAQAKLEAVMLKVIYEKEGKINERELFEAMQADKEFDKALFWRFNLNKLMHLLDAYYMKTPDTDSIEAIYKTKK